MKIPDSWLKANQKAANIGYLLNLDSAVGENSANRADDVMLVQYILMTTLADPKPTAQYEKPPHDKVNNFWDFMDNSIANDINLTNQIAYEYRRLAKTFFDDQAPNPDGKCDSVTKTWIRMFQMRNLRRYVSAIDGRVDPIDPKLGPMAKSTMLRLNVALPVWRFDIEKSDAPAALKQALRNFRQ